MIGSNKSTDHHDDAIEQVLREARARQSAPADVRARAFDHLYRHWRRRTYRQRAVRFAAPLAVAATLIVGVMIAFRPAIEPSATPTLQVAELRRLTGEQIAFTSQSGAVEPVGTESTVLSGYRVDTGPASRVALSWLNGGTLRIDENSSVQFENERQIRLLEGAIYYDSYDYVSRQYAASGAIAVETEYGSMRHVGTQFAARIAPRNLVVRVREGAVLVDSNDSQNVIDAQTEAMFDTSGKTFQQPLARFDDAWQWTELVAPEFLSSGKPPLEVLQWATRETGRDLEFMSDAARDRASSGSIAGLDHSSPRQALAALEHISGLRIRAVNGSIEVDVSE